jgi:hypothetical protein
MSYMSKRMKEPSSWAGVGGAVTSIIAAWATKDMTLLVGAVASLAAIVMPEGGAAPEAPPTRQPSPLDMKGR